MDSDDVWFRLLTQIEHILRECQRPAVQRHFRALGPQRLRRAQLLLRVERDALLRMCAGWVAFDKVSQSTEARAFFCDDLADDYQMLADSFRDATAIAESRGDAVQAEWLRRRADIHTEQSHFLRG